jgi:membrane dipeptidase
MDTNEKQLSSDILEHAKELHKSVPLIDGHNDLPGRYREKVKNNLSKIDINKPQKDFFTDIPRLREGLVGGQFFSAFVSPDTKKEELVQSTLEQIDLIYYIINRYPETFQLALSANQVEEAFKSGKIASLIGVEGGHSINNSLAVLRVFYKLGARYMTLTHNRDVSWAASATDGGDKKGLKKFGEKVIEEMNRLGMMVDLSHVSLKTMNDVLNITKVPVIFSHSSARSLVDNPRNVPDDVLKRLQINGGIIMVTFVPGFISNEGNKYYKKIKKELNYLEDSKKYSKAKVKEEVKKWCERNPGPEVRLRDVALHIDHIRNLIGVDYIGIGSDFDGTLFMPDRLEDVSKFPLLTAELIRRGYSDTDIKKILGGNILRVVRQVEEATQK